MPFPLKIQPVEGQGSAFPEPADAAKPAPAAKSRLKRLFERQFTCAQRTSSSGDKANSGGDGKEKETTSELEPSSLCLDKMVQIFMEAEPNERPPPPPRCGRRRCNCFNVNCDDSSEDDLDYADSSAAAIAYNDAADFLRSLVPCASTAERNLLADTFRIVEKSKSKACCGGRGNRGSECRKVVADDLVTLGLEASVCLSRWDKSPYFPAGEYEYVDVIAEGGERLIVDIDFRSEFEIARSTKSYRAVLQVLPVIFVGREERLEQIIAVASEAARQSLKKKGLHVPPWRKPEYMRAKWLSPHQRVAPPPPLPEPPASTLTGSLGSQHDGGAGVPAADTNQFVCNKDEKQCGLQLSCSLDFHGELELRREESGQPAISPSVLSQADPPASVAGAGNEEGEGTEVKVARAVSSVWQLPAVKPKAPLRKGAKVVTGLASIVRDLH
uniref:1,6-anhydro-N-acetylmuramyl-L-alanine amidase AmpD n=2 Tax=Anthurium amnicola TaxID=1678845 RepID=A0A1D1XTS5_9ARAE